MRDVARRAGVSVSTVSHVVNNSRTVSETYRRRVMTAMEELGYRPNALARNLRRQRTSTIGMIVPDSANPFFAEVARAIEDASFEQNYSVILCNSEGNLDKQRAYTDVLIEHRVAGIVFVAAGVSTELVNDLRLREVPTVVVDREVPGVAVDTVLTNHAQGGRLATEHLIELGHRRIGCISGGSELSPSADRLTGYRQALARHSLPYDPALTTRGDFQFEGGYRAAMRLLKPPLPTAIFACNDLMAVGCMSAAIELDLSIPRDLSVVGFDDIRLASFTNPPLTTVVQPKYEIGVLAVEMLLRRMDEPEAPPQLQRLDTHLQVRQSTAAPRERETA
jgi:LacI family transcriptional regulator